VIQPAQSVPTAGVFQSPDLTRNTPEVKILDFSGRSRFVPCVISGEQLITARSSEALDKVSGFGRNDLQPVVLSKYPVMQRVLDWLSSAGFDARMTGSGACLFTESDSLQDALLARQKMVAKMRIDSTGGVGGDLHIPIQAIFACSGLQEHPLRHWVES